MKRHRHRLTRTEAIKNRQLQMTLRRELEVKRESLTPVALSGLQSAIRRLEESR
jgi:hypothetical protein